MSYSRFPGVKVFSAFSGSLPDMYYDGISYVSCAVIVGNDGLEAFLSRQSGFDLDHLREGRFWLLYKKNQAYTICTDDCGQDVLFYYHVDNIWAFSNSFLALVEHLALHRVPLHLNDSAIASFYIPGGFGETLISGNTAVRQIKVLPRNFQMRIVAGKFSIESRYLAHSDRSLHQRAMPDLDVLIWHISAWRSRLKALVENESGREFNVDVSGGADSRILLGLLLTSQIDLSKVKFISNRALKDDYRIAEMLAHKYGFSLVSASGNNYGERLSATEQFELYIYGCLGVYHKAYFPRFRARPGAFRLHGGGGEVMREYYSGDFLSFIGKFKKFIPTEFVFSLINQDYRSCLDSGSYSCANDHYVDFRCRFHFGRNWYKANEAFLITPLLSSCLIQEYSSLSSSARSKRYLHLAYYLLLDPELLSIPFDEAGKSFPQEDVERMRSYISQWKTQVSCEDVEPEIFIGSSPEVVAYSWGERGGSIEDLFQVELKSAENSKFVSNYFSTHSPGYVASIAREKDFKRQIRKLSHVLLLQKLEEFGVIME